MLGCACPGNEDSIEHYSRCTVGRTLSANFIGLPATHHSHWLGDFVVLGVSRGVCNDIALVKRAVAVYAIYRATNHLRHHASNDAQVIIDMLQQYAREAVRGHSKATAYLEKPLDGS